MAELEVVRPYTRSLVNRQDDSIYHQLLSVAVAMYALVACSSIASQGVTREQIVAAVRREVHAREPNSIRVRDGDIYGIASGQPGRNGIWRVWVFPVTRPIGDDSGHYIDIPDGGRELALSRSGALLSYKRVDTSPGWLRPEDHR